MTCLVRDVSESSPTRCLRRNGNLAVGPAAKTREEDGVDVVGDPTERTVGHGEVCPAGCSLPADSQEPLLMPPGCE